MQGVGTADGKVKHLLRSNKLILMQIPNHQSIEKCWLNIKNRLILWSFVPGVTVSIVSDPFWSGVFKCANTAL